MSVVGEELCSDGFDAELDSDTEQSSDTGLVGSVEPERLSLVISEFNVVIEMTAVLVGNSSIMG